MEDATERVKRLSNEIERFVEQTALAPLVKNLNPERLRPRVVGDTNSRKMPQQALSATREVLLVTPVARLRHCVLENRHGATDQVMRFRPANISLINRRISQPLSEAKSQGYVVARWFARSRSRLLASGPWATLGLVRMVPPILDPAVRQKQAIAVIVAINGKIGRNEGDPEKPVTSADIGWGAYDDDDPFGNLESQGDASHRHRGAGF